MKSGRGICAIACVIFLSMGFYSCGSKDVRGRPLHPIL
jgi:hypothetical protein